MSDLDPLFDGTSLDDPNVTRLMVRHLGLGRAGRMLERAASVATSVTVVITESGACGEVHVDAAAHWRPEGVRVEMLVMEHATDPTRLQLRDALTRSGRSWRVLDRPMGGRASAIAAAIEQSEHEFVIVSTSGGGPFELVASALSYMWVDGADVALLQWEDEVEDASAREVDALGLAGLELQTSEDAAGVLAEWLGLSGTPTPGRLVVMRRWVARWLFNEIGRAIDPATELADRARLLGIGIVQMIEPMPPAGVRTPPDAANT